MWNLGKPKKIDVSFELSSKGDQNAHERFLKFVCVVGHLGAAPGFNEGRKGGVVVVVEISCLQAGGRTGSAYIQVIEDC